MKKTVEQTAAKTKAQTEQFQAAGAQAFREGVDKSVAGFSEMNAQSKRNLEAMVESASAAQKGAEALSQQALAYGKKSWEENLAAAQSSGQAQVQITRDGRPVTLTVPTR